MKDELKIRTLSKFNWTMHQTSNMTLSCSTIRLIESQ